MTNSFEKLEEGKRTLYKGGYFSGDYNQDLYLKKSNDDGSNKPKFYISVFTKLNGDLTQQGYIYFYIDYETKTSDFIGINVEAEYRNLNIASFLVASWIELCLNNGFDFLGVNKKQRKPFLLYLLKTYGFEIFDKSLYETRPDVITIGKSLDPSDKGKYLLFKDPRHEKVFMGTNVYKHDNYEIVQKPEGIILLDKIILPLQSMKSSPVNYELLDTDLAQAKTENVISRHKR